MSGKDDGSISTYDRNRIKKLRRLAKIGELIGAGEGCGVTTSEATGDGSYS